MGRGQDPGTRFPQRRRHPFCLHPLPPGAGDLHHVRTQRLAHRGKPVPEEAMLDHHQLFPGCDQVDQAGLQRFSWFISLGAVISMSAVLLVFQYGQPRIFMAMARDGLLPRFAAKIHPKYRTPHITTIITGVFVATWALVGDAGETYDLTNIGTLFAFALVCIGVLVLRKTDPDRKRPFRVPFVWPVCIGGALACAYVMQGLPVQAWRRFGIWLVIGLALYFFYGYKNSTLRSGEPQR